MRFPVWLLATAYGMASLAWTASATPDLSQRVTTPLKAIDGVKPPATPATAPAGAISSESHTLVLSARRLMQQGEYEDAARALEAVRQREAADAYEPLALLAQVQAAMDALDQARESALEAIRLDPNGADAYYVLGKLIAVNDSKRDAISYLRSATLTPGADVGGPNVTAAWYWLGVCLEHEGYALAAAEAYGRFDELVWGTAPEHRHDREVVDILLRHPAGLIGRQIDLLLSAKRVKPAVLAAENALDLRPGDPYLMLLKTRTLLESGAAEEAWRTCQRVLDDAESAAAAIPLAVRAARDCGALEAWTRDVSRREPTTQTREFVAALAEELERREDFALAAPLWTALTQMQPTSATPALRQSAALARLGDAAQALAPLERFFAAHPQTQVLPCDALRIWRESVSTSLKDSGPAVPQTGDAAQLLTTGLVAAALEQDDVASACWSRLGALTDAPPLARTAEAQLALACGDWKTAKELAAKTLDADPEQAGAQFTLGVAADGLDEYDAAEGALREALRLAPEETQIALALARRFERLGERTAAQRYYQHALSYDATCGEAFEGAVDSYLAGGKIAVARRLVSQAEFEMLPPGVRRRANTALAVAREAEREGAYMLDPRYSTNGRRLAELRRECLLHANDAVAGRYLTRWLAARREYDEALEALNAAASAAAAADETLLLRAELAQYVLDYDAAIAAYETLLSRYPNRVSVMESLARCCRYDFRAARERELWRRLIANAPDDDHRQAYQHELLYSYYMRRDTDGALAMLDEISKAEGAADAYAATRVGVLLSGQRYDEAVALAQEQLDADPEDVDRRGLLIYTLRESRRLDDLETQLRRWLDESGRSLTWAASLVETLVARERPAEALGVLDALQPATERELTVVGLLRGGALAAAGRIDEATAVFDKLMQADSYFARNAVDELRSAYILALIRARRFDRALELCDAWLADDRRRIYAASEALPEESREAALLDAREQSLELKRTVLQTAGREIDYRRTMEEMLRLLPDDVHVFNDLGYSWADAGLHLERALRMTRTAVAESPLQPAYLDSLGWVYYKSGDFASAVKHLRRATQLIEGADPIVYDHLGDAEQRRGDAQAATAAWEEAERLAQQKPTGSLPVDYSELQTKVAEKLAATRRGDAPATAPTGEEQQR